MDYLTLKKQVDQLGAMLDSRPLVARAALAGGRGLVLVLKEGRDFVRLVVQIDRANQGLWLVDHCDELGDPPRFIHTINRLLVNGRIMGVAMARDNDEPGFDRVVELKIRVADNLFGHKTDYFLIAEFTGRVADVFVCDSERKVIDRLGKTPNNSIGLTYSLPPSERRADPFSCTSADLQKLLAAPPDTWIDRIGAMSPQIKKETLFVTGDDVERRSAAFQKILTEWQTSVTAFVYHEEQKARCISAYPLTHLEKYQVKIFPSVNEALVWVETNFREPKRIEAIRKQVVGGIARDIKRKERLICDQRALLEKYKNSESYQKIGNLLVANLYQIKPGQRQITLQDWETGEDTLVELDSTKSPAASAQRYFHLYKKAQRGIKQVTQRLANLEKELQWLSEQLWFARTATAESEFFIEKKIRQQNAKKKKLGKNKSKADKGRKRVHFEPLLQINDCRYYAGKNSKQNDLLTFNLAKKDDYWFHANDLPGSHVILKKQGEVNEEDLYLGALIAAYYSLARESGKVAVDYTQVANVKRIPGGAPGQVSYTGQKTIFANPAADHHLLKPQNPPD